MNLKKHNWWGKGFAPFYTHLPIHWLKLTFANFKAVFVYNKLIIQIAEIFNSRGKLSRSMCVKVDKMFLEFEMVLKIQAAHWNNTFYKAMIWWSPNGKDKEKGKWRKGVKVNGVSKTLNLSTDFYYLCPTLIVAVSLQTQLAGPEIVVVLCYCPKLIRVWV